MEHVRWILSELNEGGAHMAHNAMRSSQPRARRGLAAMLAARLAGAVLAVAGLGCAQTLDAYQDQKPEFVLQEFFDGPLIARGALYDRSGSVIRRFVADIRGSWEDGEGTLDEIFWWADGEEQTRVWKIGGSDARGFSGTAGDIVGQAVGRGAGNAFNWAYKLRIALDEDSSIDVRMDDWIYLIDQSTVLNRTKMTWFGIRVGEVVLTIEKVGEDELYGKSPYPAAPTQSADSAR